LPRFQQRYQYRLDAGLPLLRRQVQEPHVFPIGPPRLLRRQRVISAPVRHRRVQVVAVDIARERAGLAYQPVDHVAIVDAVLRLAAQPFHRLDRRPRVRHLDDVRTNPHVDGLADQARRYRVGVPQHPQRAAAADLHAPPFRGLQARRRQRPQPSLFLREPLVPPRVPPAAHLAQELLVGRTALEVTAAAQQQRLLNRLLEAAMTLLAVAVLMAAGRVRRLGRHPVMG